MKLRRALMIGVAAVAIAFGSVSFGLSYLDAGEPTAAACARCGDGVCAKSCENQYTCPKDCGSTGGTTSAAR